MRLLLIFPSVPDDNEAERPGVRCRRNSDSFLCFKPNEDEVALMKLKHAENQLNLKDKFMKRKS
ncbi:hypothetical protein OS493_025294 [Desmophyllum pertusum]|uniref:Uncharacterized protein n=1 Tax=Desmophyllum pertusum TaxID=174260 RepID=A0A9W9ZCA9_9CNID|nr:hypothetical protein OS493_025294 [Desmophyllum pertusum]